MSTWQISTDNGSTWATLADAGYENLRRTLRSGRISTVAFDAKAATALTDDYAIAHGSTVLIRKNSTRWFHGRCLTLPRFGTHNAEQITYELACPWWYLERCTYQQDWTVYDISGGSTTSANKSRVVLFQNATGSRITTGQQIEAAIDWAIAKGAPITKGNIDSGVALPYDERTNLKCSDVINACLRWHPDWVVWFDHSTTPNPTIHVRARSSLATVTLPLSNLDHVQLSPRYDTQVPGVHITYEKAHDADGTTYNTIETDTAGDTAALDTVFATIDLQGSSITTSTQKIITEDLPEDGTGNEDLTNKAFWKARVPWLANVPDADLTVHDPSRDHTNQERILLEGQVQDWMFAVDSDLSTITAQVDYVLKDGSGNVIEAQTDRPVSLRLMVTNAITKTYRRTTSYDTGETTPTGVAAALHASWNALQYDGLAKLTQQECSGSAIPGQKLCISGGRTEWATMNALIQETTELVDRGHTTIRIAPPRHLEADTLVGLFRALRSRRFSWSRLSRTTGDVTDGDLNLSGKAATEDAADGSGQHKRLVIRNSATEDATQYAHEIDLDPAAIDHADDTHAANRTLRPRELTVLTKDGSGNPQLQLIQILASSPYDDAQLLKITPDGTAPNQTLIWNNTTSAWEPTTLTQITALTAWRLDKTGHNFQVKTRTGYVLNPGTESAWTNITDANGGQLDEGAVP